MQAVHHYNLLRMEKLTTVLAPTLVMFALSHAMMAMIRTTLELGAVRVMDHGMVILHVKVS